MQSKNRSIHYESASDRDLLALLQDDDRKAFEALYMRYYAMLYTFAMRYLKNRHDAEDVLQQVFVKLWIIRRSLWIASNLKGYLFYMMKYRILNHIRNANNALQHNYMVVQLRPLYDEMPDTEPDSSMTERLKHAIKHLSPQQRIVAQLRCEGYSNQEIARKMNISVHTVNSHYREMLKALKKKLLPIIKIILLSFLICENL